MVGKVSWSALPPFTLIDASQWLSSPAMLTAVVCEATYGVSRHLPREQREAHFLQRVTDTLRAGGHVLLPVVAMGRAQVQKETPHMHHVGGLEGVVWTEGCTPPSFRSAMELLRNPSFSHNVTCQLRNLVTSRITTTHWLFVAVQGHARQTGL
jgi:hypothetical protein